nr:cytochrome-c peroxidase [Paraburkholderia sp. BL23I1N1]
MTALGKQLFFDASLSGSGRLACASCHSPDHGFFAGEFAVGATGR